MITDAPIAIDRETKLLLTKEVEPPRSDLEWFRSVRIKAEGLLLQYGTPLGYYGGQARLTELDQRREYAKSFQLPGIWSSFTPLARWWKTPQGSIYDAARKESDADGFLADSPTRRIQFVLEGPIIITIASRNQMIEENLKALARKIVSGEYLENKYRGPKPPIDDCSLEFTSEDRGRGRLAFKRIVPAMDDIYTQSGLTVVQNITPLGRTQIEKMLDLASVHLH
jgi:hypothetical protein